MAKGLKGATVHEVSGGEVMKGFVVHFATYVFFFEVYIIEYIYIHKLYLSFKINS